MLLLGIFAGLLLLLFLLFFTPTLIGVDYLYKDKKQKLRIRFRLLGIPFSVPVSLGKKANKKPEKEKKTLSANEYIDLAKKIYGGYQEAKNEIQKLLSDIKQSFGGKEIYFAVRYGTKNPAVTGMLNGAVWTASSLLLKILDEIFGAEKKTLDIQPDFQNVCMNLHIKGTFCFKLFDAVRFALKVKRLVNIIKNHTTEQKEPKKVS